jgi:pimeloyl-ACP methyl ester carboxylesterase
MRIKPSPSPECINPGRGNGSGEMANGYRARCQDVVIGLRELPGILSIPDHARGLIIFAHGSGSSRHSPRNAHIAAALHGRGFATLLFDLLSEDEAHSQDKVFDIELLTTRVLNAITWVLKDARTRALPIGLFGASTGAAAALAAAAERPDVVCAVVSRGGRTDLTGRELGHVRAPTLLVVGRADRHVLKLNENSYKSLTCIKHIVTIPGATHLFEQKGAMDAVVREAAH